MVRMKIAILGYDVEGKASYDYFAAQGHELTICDQNPEVNVPYGVPTVLGDDYLNDLDRFDLLVRTAGLHPQKILEKNPNITPKITTNINEFLKVSPSKKIIGVTGTKGKGTTSTLIAKMLEAAGKSAYLAGNIGLSPLDILNKLSVESWLVLELTNFQLIDIKQSPRIGVCLMVTAEHLDWHPNMSEYTEAKSRLFAHQTPDDIAIYYAKNDTSQLVAGTSPGHKIPYYKPPGAYIKDDSVTIDDKRICQTDELKLLGKHNWQNVCAAVTAVWQVTQDVEAIRFVLTSFSGLPHRLELVRELDGVRYYNDSFATTPEAATVAIQAFSEPKIVIMGGRTKGIPLEQLARPVIASSVKNVIAIGETAGEIATALTKAGFGNVIRGGKTIEAIVQQARELTKPGDVVLLSPACTSFDMFKDYKDRGDKFRAAVQALA